MSDGCCSDLVSAVIPWFAGPATATWKEIGLHVQTLRGLVPPLRVQGLSSNHLPLIAAW